MKWGIGRAAAAIGVAIVLLGSVTAAGREQQPVKKYSGAPMDLDLQGADIRMVLRTFAETNGLNIVIDPAVRGTVDIKLTAVPWDQALDIILKGAKLGYVVDGTVVRVAPLDVILAEEKQRRELADEQALAGALEVKTYVLSYAQALKLEPLIKYAALSPRGEIRVDERTNTLIIRDLPERQTAAAALITTLDRAEPQVEINAQIVQTNHDVSRDLGVRWGAKAAASPEIGNTTTLAFPNKGSITGSTGLNQTGPAPNSSLSLAMGAINGAVNLDVTLTALEKKGQLRVLSAPHVTTQNNHEAQMTQGDQIPYQTVSNNTVTTQFKDAALKLIVTPQITGANTVIMQIELENATPDFSRSPNNPSIKTQRALTRLQVADGATTVIGGIVVSKQDSATDQTPGLGSIPLLKWLFRHEQSTDSNNELLIFITPRILRSQP
jgi:type IV pilus assembly protein PilQ